MVLLRMHSHSGRIKFKGSTLTSSPRASAYCRSVELGPDVLLGGTDAGVDRDSLPHGVFLRNRTYH